MDRKDMYENYKTEAINYTENMTPEQIKMEEREKEIKVNKKLKKARKELGMPERPWSSYKWFLSEMFTERGDEKVQTFFKLIKDKWNSLSDSEKEIYYKKHKKSQQQYVEEMMTWEESMIEAGRFDVIRKSTLNKLKTADMEKTGSKTKNKVIEKATKG